MKCNYCNIYDGLYKLKNGKLCCQPHYNSCSEIRKKNSNSIKKAHKEGRIPGWLDHIDNGIEFNRSWAKGLSALEDPRIHAQYKLEEVFTYGGKGPHKKILISENGHKCERCKLSEWQGSPINLELDHINGDNKDNRRDNLRVLCLNCHSMTPTFRRAKHRNKKALIIPDDEFINALKLSKNIRQALLKLGLVAKGLNYKRAKSLINKHNIIMGK